MKKNKQLIKKKRTPKTIEELIIEFFSVFYGLCTSPFLASARWVYVKMTYTDVYVVAIPAGTVYDDNYRANSLFDPYRTGVGHQPLFYDQYAPFYNRYRIHKTDYDVQMSASTTSFNGIVLCVNGAKTYTTAQQGGEAVAQKRVKWRTSNVGASALSFKGTVNMASINGRSEQSYHTDDTTGSLYNTNPVETIDFHNLVHNFGVVAISVAITVTYTYHGILYDAITPDTS